MEPLKKALLTVGTIIATMTLVGTSLAHAREQIRIAGSSTVYPFVTSAAEIFAESDDYRTPIVESTGTGGGFKLFCSGIGENYPDINNASRAIKDSERELCAENGISEITELVLGYDGIVLAASTKNPAIPLSKHDIFLALAHDVPKDGKLVTNHYESWKEINPVLPDRKIRVYGPPPTSGTRDAFVELVMEEACVDLPEFKAAYADKNMRKKQCHLLREDGRYIEAGEDDNLIIQKLEHNEDALGIVGYGFLEQNTGRVHGSPIDGIVPNYRNIENGSYKVSRSLYVYIKEAHLDLVPGLSDFARELVSNAAIGPDGYLIMRGLLPMTEALRTEMQERAKKLRAQE